MYIFMFFKQFIRGVMRNIFTSNPSRSAAITLGIVVAAGLAVWFISHGDRPASLADALSGVDAGTGGAKSLTAATALTRTGSAAQSEVDRRREEMLKVYSGLEQDRHDLDVRLGDVNTRLWDLKLPAEQAAAVTRALIQASALLKDPPLLGAIGAVAEIEQERARVRAAMAGLDGLAPVIESARASAGRAGGN